MREILFRGKSVDNSKWFFGHYVHQYGADMIYLPAGTDREGGFDYYHIIPETVGQYTGLTDNNGKKIFEGDIVEGLDFTAEDGGYGIVTFDDGAFEIVGSCDNNIVGTFHENYFGKDFEVIGNIHDNPELLKGGE